MVRKCIFIFAALLLWTSSAYAADIFGVFRQALLNDPLLGSSKYKRSATRGDRDEVCGRLWPQITVPASYTYYNQGEPGTFLGQGSANTNGAIEGQQAMIGVALSQTLFDMQKYTACRTGRLRVNQGAMDYEIALEDLIYRVIRDYTDILSASDKVLSAGAAVEWRAALLKETRKSFEAETLSQKDVDAAVAGLKIAEADKKVADNALSAAVDALEAILNGSVSAEDLSGLREELPMLVPEPPDPYYWADLAQKENLKLVASKLSVEKMKYDVEAAASRMYPVVDVFAKHTFFDNNIDRASGSLDSDNGSLSTDAVGVSFTWPLFTGGSNTAALSAAKDRHEASRKEHEALLRSTGAEARKALLGLISSSAGIEAAKAALASSQSAYDAVNQGVEAETSTRTDLLNAQLKLLEARAGFEASRYGYILGVAEFWRSIGALSPSSIGEINGWLRNEAAKRTGKPQDAASPLKTNFFNPCTKNGARSTCPFFIWMRYNDRP
ncbi:MAG: TolC family protein [Pseudomonadota bacterium]